MSFVPRRPLRTALAAALLAAACGDGVQSTEQQSASDSGAYGAAAPPPPALAAPAAPPLPSRARARAGSVAGGPAPAEMREEALELTTRDAAAAPAPPAPGQEPTAAGQPVPAATSMLIRTGTATLEVDSLEEATARVRAAAERVGGYVANSSLQVGRDQVRSAELQIKVPAARFDELVRGLDPIGRVEAVNVSTQDVGEEYVDVQARAANARRLEERLVQLLATRTGRLDDVLAVERELARVREEIERSEGRMRYLRTRAAMSTLTVTVHEPMPLVGNVRGDEPIANAVRQAWRNFVSFVSGLIAMSGVLIPLALIAWATYALYRRWNRRRPTPPPRTGPVVE